MNGNEVPRLVYDVDPLELQIPTLFSSIRISRLGPVKNLEIPFNEA